MVLILFFPQHESDKYFCESCFAVFIPNASNMFLTFLFQCIQCVFNSCSPTNLLKPFPYPNTEAFLAVQSVSMPI